MFAKTFRNSLLASSLLIGASLLVGPAAMADPDPVTAVINEVNEVSFVPEMLDREIDQDATESNFPLGTLIIQNNNVNGWELEVRSENNGELRLDGTSNTHKIAYGTLTLESDFPESSTDTITPNDTDALFASGDYSTAVAGEESRVVRSTLVTGNLPAGTYSDILVFTLTSKEGAPD